MSTPSIARAEEPEGEVSKRQRRACVVGYGVAGRMHARILGEQGLALTIVDPKHQDLPKTYQSMHGGVTDLPDSIVDTVDLWSVCCPTDDHLAVLKAIVARDAAARVVMEKPACLAHEIEEFSALLLSHPEVRVAVVDQYSHTALLPALSALIAEFEPAAVIDEVRVAFTKNRGADIARGRFIDRSYGVLGYEWLHMLAILRRILPAGAFQTYLDLDPSTSEYFAAYHPELFLSALTERVTVPVAGRSIDVELATDILAPTMIVGRAPRTEGPAWRKGRRAADERHRYVVVRAGATRFAAHFEPVTAPGGLQLERNLHRLTAERAGRLLYDEVIEDSPLETAIVRAVARLRGETPSPDLAPLRRIAATAEHLRRHAPGEAGVTMRAAG